MLISIVLPVYNVGKYIERSLLSCMGQTCSGIEIIVVDDCGHDDSIEQAERLAQKDQRIKIVRNKENMGTYHARRIGVENSTGEYILFLDPDDELRLEAVDKISAAALGGADLIFYGVQNFPPKKAWQSTPGIPFLSKEVSYLESIDKILSCSKLQFGTPGKVIRRTVLEKSYSLLRIKDDQRLIFGEDVLLFAAVLMEMRTSVSLEARLYVYYENESSISSIFEDGRLLFNANQLGAIIAKIEALPYASRSSKLIKASCVKRLEINRLRLEARQRCNFRERALKYVSILSRTRSFKDAVRLLVFLISIGHKNI